MCKKLTFWTLSWFLWSIFRLSVWRHLFSMNCAYFCSRHHETRYHQIQFKFFTLWHLYFVPLTAWIWCRCFFMSGRLSIEGFFIWQLVHMHACSLANQCCIRKQKVVGSSPVTVNMLCPRVRHFTLITPLDPDLEMVTRPAMLGRQQACCGEAYSEPHTT